MVPHRSTNQARTCLTSLSRREAVLSCWYGRSYSISTINRTQTAHTTRTQTEHTNRTHKSHTNRKHIAHEPCNKPSNLFPLQHKSICLFDPGHSKLQTKYTMKRLSCCTAPHPIISLYCIPLTILQIQPCNMCYSKLATTIYLAFAVCYMEAHQGSQTQFLASFKQNCNITSSTHFLKQTL